MPKRKKNFLCGHKGYGSFCHICKEKETLQKQKKITYAEKKKERDAWQALFDNDVIDLTMLPTHKLVTKARQVLEALHNHPFHELGGKRLRHDRNIISIPLDRDYRILCRDQHHQLIPLLVMSHEDYNVRKPGHNLHVKSTPHASKSI